MKKLIPLFVLLFVFKNIRSQIYQPITFPEKVDNKYIVEPLKEQEKYFKKLQKSIPKKKLESFTVSQTFGKANLFTNGDIYFNWPAMENYVNQILDSIIPSTLASKKIHAYIGRNSAINAYCLYDGTMIVNVGLLAEVKNEAALASIMGHELGHFMKNHILNRFKNSLKKPKKLKKNELAETINAMGFSQKNELESDQLGFGIAKSANYDLEEAMSNFEIFIREEEYYKKRNSSSLVNTDSVTVDTKAGKFKANTLEKLLSTHPDMKDRKEKLLAYIASNPQTKKSKFKIDADYFSALQSQARLESINLIFNSNDYEECLERSFLYYLNNPKEISYSYYIAESTRRLCLLDYRLRKKGFLAERLTNDGFNEGQGILHDLKFLVPNEEKFKAIKASDLVGKIPFETYKDAFAYFTKNLIDKKYDEAYLMRALFENNKAKIDDNVSKYLASANPKHREYAENYRNNNLSAKIAGYQGEIVMVPKVHFFRNDVFNEKYIYGNVSYYYKKSEILGSEMSYEFANALKTDLPDVEAISMPHAAKENFNTKYSYETTINRTLLARRDENEGFEVVHYYKNLIDEDYVGKIDIFRLDPDTWEFFNTNKIGSITQANYTRHVNLGGRKIRNILLIMAIPFAGLTALFAIGVATNYKMLTMYSYDARMGSLYYDYKIQARKINAKKAVKMFEKMKQSKTEFINDYNERNSSDTK